MTPNVLTFEEFCVSKGFHPSDYVNAGTHSPFGFVSDRKKREILKGIQDNITKHTEQYQRLHDEYDRLLANGEVRQPKRIERLIKTAKGHPDNSSVQAARRILEKENIVW